MKKITVMILFAVLLGACASKPAQSPDFIYGNKLYNNFVNYYLSGKARLAERAFHDAEEQFLRMDAMCNLSRIYIGRYVLDEAGEDLAALEKASEFASLGACTAEGETIKFLLGKSYEKSLLPEPYYYTAEADTEKIVSLSGDSDFPDYTRTRLMRRAAIDYIVTDPAKSEKLSEAAIVIDRFNGWSLNILRDLIIIKLAKEKMGQNTEDIKKRIELVKIVLPKK
ncbi:hypothetical protein Dacet_1689 [Denitrovibrio acetiphilus DSM 12809]|uniref:Lipoprotein n=1 Tax=Denitrovibrio acetiphilus (strain DSM 12809 / NBRC 114555 / N2460) TaxID=522772 RepID=D4H8V4_DENA2|nr:hypothetical protein [Denitrovibrio acetiphilus]ADD68453.1 hypothetical protein Dacet_1689 [Denitrovibrio acetiphilus DSM 12809]